MDDLPRRRLDEQKLFEGSDRPEYYGLGQQVDARFVPSDKPVQLKFPVQPIPAIPGLDSQSLTQLLKSGQPIALAVGSAPTSLPPMAQAALDIVNKTLDDLNIDHPNVADFWKDMGASILNFWEDNFEKLKSRFENYPKNDSSNPASLDSEFELLTGIKQDIESWRKEAGVRQLKVSLEDRANDNPDSVVHTLNGATLILLDGIQERRDQILAEFQLAIPTPVAYEPVVAEPVSEPVVPVAPVVANQPIIDPKYGRIAREEVISEDMLLQADGAPIQSFELYSETDLLQQAAASRIRTAQSATVILGNFGKTQAPVNSIAHASYGELVDSANALSDKYEKTGIITDEDLTQFKVSIELTHEGLAAHQNVDIQFLKTIERDVQNLEIEKVKISNRIAQLHSTRQQVSQQLLPLANGDLKALETANDRASEIEKAQIVDLIAALQEHVTTQKTALQKAYSELKATESHRQEFEEEKLRASNGIAALSQTSSQFKPMFDNLNAAIKNGRKETARIVEQREELEKLNKERVVFQQAHVRTETFKDLIARIDTYLAETQHWNLPGPLTRAGRSIVDMRIRLAKFCNQFDNPQTISVERFDREYKRFEGLLNSLEKTAVNQPAKRAAAIAQRDAQGGKFAAYHNAIIAKANTAIAMTDEILPVQRDLIDIFDAGKEKLDRIADYAAPREPVAEQSRARAILRGAFRIAAAAATLPLKGIAAVGRFIRRNKLKATGVLATAAIVAAVVVGTNTEWGRNLASNSFGQTAAASAVAPPATTEVTTRQQSPQAVASLRAYKEKAQAQILAALAAASTQTTAPAAATPTAPPVDPIVARGQQIIDDYAQILTRQEQVNLKTAFATGDWYRTMVGIASIGFHYTYGQASRLPQAEQMVRDMYGFAEQIRQDKLSDEERRKPSSLIVERSAEDLAQRPAARVAAALVPAN